MVDENLKKIYDDLRKKYPSIPASVAFQRAKSMASALPTAPKTSFWDKFKKAASYDVTKPVKGAAQATGNWTNKYTPTLIKVPGAVGKGVVVRVIEK